MAEIQNELLDEQNAVVNICNAIMKNNDCQLMTCGVAKRVVNYCVGLRLERDYYRAIAEEAEHPVEAKEWAL